MKKLMHVCTLSFFMSVVLLSAGLYWYSVVSAKIPVSDIQVQLVDQFSWPGGQFRVKYSAVQDKYCPSYTIFMLEDSAGKTYQIASQTPEPNDIYLIKVPENIAKGTVLYSQTTYYRCNPFKEVLVQTPKLRLEIVS